VKSPTFRAAKLKGFTVLCRRIMCFFLSKFRRVVTWQFSCSLTPESCQFKFSSKAGSVSATLRKQTDLFNLGPSALPLRIIDDDELTPFQSASEIREFLDRTMLVEAMFESTQDLEIRSQAKKNNAIITDPFFCLKETISAIWRCAYKQPKVCFCILFRLFFVHRKLRHRLGEYSSVFGKVNEKN